LKTITSADNIEIKEAKKLHDSKHRKEKGLFFFEGVHLLEEYIKSGRTPHSIFLTEKNSDIIEDFDGKRIIQQRLYDKITAEQSPQGIFTIAKTSSLSVVHLSPASLLKTLDSPAIVLESMRDPGNVGTVIRTAVSLGVKIIFTEDCADIFNPKVIRASMGAVFFEDIYVVPSADELAKQAVDSGYNVFGAILDDKAKPLTEIEINKKSLFIIGNEGNGIKKETLEACNNYAYIPMTGKTESLNAAIASSIIIWEISKKIRDL
jgi:TrmH family RNA methyltransferase